MTRSTCCNAPCTYQGTRLASRLDGDGFDVAEIYTCDGCGNETETEYFETEEDRAELRGEYWADSERQGDK